MKKREISIKNILVNLIILLLILILFSGSNIFSNYQKYYFILLLAILFVLRLKNKLYINRLSFILIFQLILLILTITYSINPLESLNFVFIFGICVLFAIIGFKKVDAFKILDCIENYAFFFSIIIIISLLKHDLIVTNLSFLFPNNNAMLVTLNEINYNIFSGLALERAYSAFCINIGIISVLSRLNKKHSVTKFDILKLIIFVIALFSCGKRTLLVIPLLVFIFLLFVNDYKKFALNILKYTVLALCLVIVLKTFIPTVDTLLQRFSYNVGDKSYNGRTEYWKYCKEMFNNSPLFGNGINTYKSYLKSNSELKVYHAHNIYFQLLGELGIIGFLLTIFFFTSCLFSIILFYKKNKKELSSKEIYALNFSMGIQLLFLLYGMTGNTFYYYEQLLTYFFSIAIFNSIEYEVKYEKNSNNYIS